MDARTDQELVLGFRPGAGVQSRKNPRTWLTEFQVTYAPVPGQRDTRRGWSPTRTLAWRAACVRLGLRVRPWPDRRTRPQEELTSRGIRGVRGDLQN